MSGQKLRRWEEKPQTVSATNARLRRPSWAASLAKLAVESNPAAAVDIHASPPLFRVVLGLGPGRSGTKSLTELLGAQLVGSVSGGGDDCGSNGKAEHEMIVPRGRNNRNTTKKGSWGADRRLEWDAPRLEGDVERTEEESARWRVLRLLEQREAWTDVVLKFQNSNSTTVAAQPTNNLGARGWKEYNKRKSNNHGTTEDTSTSNTTAGECDKSSTDNMNTGKPFVMAVVSSVALAYVHEYLALDDTVLIAVVTRPREEVVTSFLCKTNGRNHWQKQPHKSSGAPGQSKADKTWDRAFPDMTDEECLPFVLDAAVSFTTESEDSVEFKDTPMTSNAGARSPGTFTCKPDKAAALRAYWELYNDTAHELVQRYPNNVRLFDMNEVLNNEDGQQNTLLKWCGFNEPLQVVDTTVRLNRSPKCV